MNATQKDGLSALIDNGGFEAYGRFWAFMELFYSMQINKIEFSEKIRINERTLIKHLQMNQRSLPKLLRNFSNCLGIVFRKFDETYGIVYETTIPNSLTYLRNRSRKSVILKDRTKDKDKTRVRAIKKFDDNSPPLILSKRFFGFISKWCKSKKAPNYQSWAEDIDLMIRVDKRSPKQISDKMKEVQEDDREGFNWRENILCPTTLRKRWNEGKLENIPKEEDFTNREEYQTD